YRRRRKHRVLLPSEPVIGHDDIARLVLLCVGVDDCADATADHDVAHRHSSRVVALRTDTAPHIRRDVEIDRTRENLVCAWLGYWRFRQRPVVLAGHTLRVRRKAPLSIAAGTSHG